MMLLFLLVMGLLLVLIIQILEVYLTLKLNHEMDDEIARIRDSVEDRNYGNISLHNRLYIIERKIMRLEDNKPEKKEQAEGEHERQTQADI